MTASDLEAIDVTTESGARAFNASVRGILANANTSVRGYINFASDYDAALALAKLYGERFTISNQRIDGEPCYTVHLSRCDGQQRTPASALTVACLRANGAVTE